MMSASVYAQLDEKWFLSAHLVLQEKFFSYELNLDTTAHKYNIGSSCYTATTLMPGSHTAHTEDHLFTSEDLLHSTAPS